MGNWTITVTKNKLLLNGERMIRGYALGSSSYDTGGDGFNLDGYFTSSEEPAVQCAQVDGYEAVFYSSTGSSPDGLVKVTDSYGSEVASSINLSDCKIRFVAFGDAR